MLKLSKKSIRIISVILLAVMMLMTLGGTVFAEIVGIDPQPTEPTGGAKLANTILGTLMWIGIAIAVGMMIFLGIKYVTASPDGKADLKKQLGIYILGFVLIVGATTIVGVINNAINTGLNK